MRSKLLHGPDDNRNIPNMTLGDFFLNGLDEYADTIAQIDACTNEKETNRSLKIRSIRAAIAMQKRGVTSNDVICFCTNNTIDSCVPILGALFLGAKVASLEPTLSSRLNAHLISISSPKMLFVQESSLNMIEESLSESNSNLELIVFGKSKKYLTFDEMVVPQEKEDEFRPSEVDINDVAVIFFSSGTTGLPKAICHSHYTFITESNNTFKHMMILQFNTMYWISSMIMLMKTIGSGSTRVFGSRPISGQEAYEIIEKYKIVCIFMSPILTYSLTNVKNPQDYDTSSLRLIFTSGTPIQPRQIFRLQEIFKNARVVFGYAMTECCAITWINKPTSGPLDQSKLLLGSCGQVSPGVTIKISDLETGQTLDVGQKGEICVKSNSVMVGYHKSDSSDRFDQEHYLRTGDIGYFDEDGYVFIVDRMKEMFKYLSWHIIPSVIESVLLEHEAVKEAVVFGIPQGEDGDMPAAWVTLNEGFHTTSKELQEFVAKSVSDREKLRGGVSIVNHIPRTPTGKILRTEVQALAVKSQF